MLKIVYHDQVFVDFERICAFLLENGGSASELARVSIVPSLETLCVSPFMGRSVGMNQRELVISFGKTGYIAVCRVRLNLKRVEILALRRQREGSHLREPR